jgi:hypothetical protein
LQLAVLVLQVPDGKDARQVGTQQQVGGQLLATQTRPADAGVEVGARRVARDVARGGHDGVEAGGLPARLAGGRTTRGEAASAQVAPRGQPGDRLSLRLHQVEPLRSAPAVGEHDPRPVRGERGLALVARDACEAARTGSVGADEVDVAPAGTAA